jgi:hypothetical protein
MSCPARYRIFVDGVEEDPQHQGLLMNWLLFCASEKDVPVEELLEQSVHHSKGEKGEYWKLCNPVKDD